MNHDTGPDALHDSDAPNNLDFRPRGRMIRQFRNASNLDTAGASALAAISSNEFQHKVRLWRCRALAVQQASREGMLLG